MATWADKTLIVVLILFGLTGIAFPLFSQVSAAVPEVVITVDGQVVKTLKLDGHVEKLNIAGVGGYNVVEIANKQVRVIESNCPDQLCVKQGWINRSPQQIICLPNRIVVRVTNGKASGVDTITR